MSSPPSSQPPLIAQIHQTLEATAARLPDAIALEAQNGSLTYRGLNARANHLARFLMEQGIGPGALVGVHLSDLLDMPVALYGVLKTGAAFMALEPHLPEARLAAMMEAAGRPIVLTRRPLAAALAARASAVIHLEAEVFTADSHADLAREIPTDALACVLFTSGSTGKPKAVAIDHGAASDWLAEQAAISADEASDVCLFMASYATAMVQGLLSPIAVGGRVVMVTPEERRDPLAFLERVRQAGVTCLTLAPSHFQAIVFALDALTPERRERLLDNRVRLIELVGEPLRAELVDRWRERFGHSARVVNFYGQTELSAIAAHELHEGRSDTAIVPIGQPLPGVEIHLLDAALHPVAEGQVGMLYAAGPGMAAGYLNDPDATAAKFVPNPFGPGRLCMTGDLARRQANGTLALVGRADRLVKLRGERIEPGEIEHVLEAHPHVREAVVVAREVDEHDVRLVAFIVPRQEPAPSEIALRRWVREALPEAMVPGHMVFLTALPTNTNGKRDLGELRRMPLHPVLPMTPYRREATLHQLFDEQAARTPEAAALYFAGQAISYRELNARANRLAHRLRALGVGPGVPVGLCVDRSTEMVLGILGILKADGAYAPLEPGQPRGRLASILDDMDCPVVLTRRPLLLTLPPHAATIICLEDALLDDSDEAPAPLATAEDPAYVLYTSGSTGRPKGVLGTHRGAVNRCAWMGRTFPFDPGEVACLKTSFTFVDSVWELMGALLAGVPLAIPLDDVARDPGRLVDFLAEHRVSRLVLVPSLLRAMLAACPNLGAALPALKLCVSSGETLTGELAARFLSQAPGVELLNLYGSTEVAGDATWHLVTAADREGVPIGRPLANVQVCLLDEQLRPVPEGEVGELHVSGDGLAIGYWRRPELTAERFVPEPSGEGRLYRTGDMARFRPDGSLELLGRRDHQVKINGVRVELGEVEAVLGAHPDVRACAVAVRGERLVAYVVGPAVPSELRAHLRAAVPAPMVPAFFISLEALPTTPNGKVDRAALPSPDDSNESESPEPGDELESRIAVIWREVLRLPHVGPTDDFYDLGGDSLRAVSLAIRLEEAFGRSLSSAGFTTVRDFARQLRTEAPATGAPMFQALRAGGHRKPLILFPTALGGPEAYVSLARRLPASQPVYAARLLVPEGLEPRLAPLAEQYATALMRLFPSGGVCLGGHSAGGVLAFEVARHVERMGGSVDRVVLFDSYWPSPEGDMALGFMTAARLLKRAMGERFSGAVRLLKRRIGRLVRPIRRPLREASPPTFTALPASAVVLPDVPARFITLARMWETLEWVHGCLFDLTDEAVRAGLASAWRLRKLPDEPRRERLCEELAAGWRSDSPRLADMSVERRRDALKAGLPLRHAVFHYTIESSIEAPIYLFAAEGTAGTVPGWAIASRRGCVRISVPGEHGTLVRPPHDRALAVALEDVLSQPAARPVERAM